MYSAIVVDSDIEARALLRGILEVNCPNIGIVAEADGLQSGYEAIIELAPQVLFLDIHLADGSGFDMLKRFQNPSFRVIITTEKPEYAIEAFKYGVVDYLLKPVTVQDLESATVRLIQNLEKNLTGGDFDIANNGTRRAHGTTGKLVLRTAEEVNVVDVDSIIRCESCNNTTIFHIVGMQPIKVSKTLKEYEDILSDRGFVRCHQSHLINRTHLVKVVRFPVAAAHMDDGSQIPISVRKRGII